MDFKKGNWCYEIDLRDFIQLNYTPYEGDKSFLKGPSEKTRKLWKKVLELLDKERKNGGVLDIDTHTISTIVSHKPGYIDKESEVIVGLQTDEPLKRAIMPFGGIRMVVKGSEAYGKKVDPDIIKIFNEIRKTHNQGVYDVYTPEMRRAKKAGIITGLPDAYGRGRIIGDYRRVPLYGVDRLIEEKNNELVHLEFDYIDAETTRDREEIQDQIKSLELLKKMGESYGFDISKPAVNSKEAVQWLYFAYLAAIKEQNGAAMSLGRVSTFLDIYFEHDLKKGIITEEEVQELVDQLVIKLRMVRFLRTPEYEALFSGDPTWVTESIGGMSLDGRTLVTKSSFRILHNPLKNSVVRFLYIQVLFNMKMMI